MLLVKIVESFGSQTQGIPAAEPTTPTFSPGTWQLTFSDGTPLVEPQVVASGMPMEEPIRFVACVVEHSRSNDAEFQVLNKAAEASPHGGSWGVQMDHRSKVVILHWVCLKCGDYVQMAILVRKMMIIHVNIGDTMIF